MSAAGAERTVIKLNPKGEEADPIFESELFDPRTGERIAEGWRREKADHLGRFTVPGPELVATGLQPQYAPHRPGRYLSPMQLEGRVW